MEGSPVNSCWTLACADAIKKKNTSTAIPATGESLCMTACEVSLYLNFICNPVASRQAQTCTDGPSHQKVKITKSWRFQASLFLWADVQQHILGGAPSVSPRSILSPPVCSHFPPSGLLVGSSCGPLDALVQVPRVSEPLCGNWDLEGES